jgi:hypothetical protein
MQTSIQKQTVWSPTQVQFLYRHRNGRYYVRTFARGKEKCDQPKNETPHGCEEPVKEHVEAAEWQRTTGNTAGAVGKMTFGEAVATYREQLKVVAIRLNTKAYREAGMKLALRTWKDVEALKLSAHHVENG